MLRGLREPRREIAKMQLPVHFACFIRKLNGQLIKQGPGLRFVTGEVTERGRMSEREVQRLQGAVEADEPERAGQIPRGTQDGEGVGGGAQADIPDHEFSGMPVEAFAESQLIHIQSLRLGDRANDRVKGFVMRQRMEAVVAADELNELVVGSSSGQWPVNLRCVFNLWGGVVPNPSKALRREVFETLWARARIKDSDLSSLRS